MIVSRLTIQYYKMEEFQMKVKTEEYPELQQWPWYVDDSVLKCRRNRAEEILNHLNSQEPEIKFTKEEEENNKIAVLDLELNINRKRKKIDFSVHYKKTNTNITIKKQSNHSEATKRGVIKGYADRARTLCDPQYLEGEMQNVEDVFVDNGYARREVKLAMKEKKETTPTEEEQEKEEKVIRGIISIPNIPHITRTFDRIAKQHQFRTATRATNKVKDLAQKAKTPLGEKNKNVVYNIPCGCGKFSYTGETDRKWKTRKKEHMDKVRLTKEDIKNGNMTKATERMNTGDGGLAKHSAACEQQIKWEEAKIVGRETRMTQRKYLEGVMSLKEKGKGRIPLNSYNQLEPWQPIIYEYMGT